ncbi:MAG: glycosyltransferase [Clostridia bacterium]|nr:glycosyltransferase [Clostridia bacterium]
MKKLIFGITGLTLGGAERVLVDIANKLSQNYEVTIFTIYSKGILEKQLLPQVKVKSIFKKEYNELTKLQKKVIIPLKILLQKNKIYKKFIKKQYDIEVAFLEGPITRIFSCKGKTKKIAWIHNDITQVFGQGLKAKIKKKIDKNIYNKYNKLIFVSNDNLKKFENQYGSQIAVPKQVIYNYIDAERVKLKSEEEIEKLETNSFVTVARLVPQKAIDRFIKVHAELIKEGYNHEVYVIGEGPEKPRLEELIKKLNVEKTFKLLGKKENPYPYIKQADYFCLFSKFEGYGMVIEEAKILEKNILITNTAAVEAIQDYKKAKVFENTHEGIKKGIKGILTKNEEVERKTKTYDNKNIISEIIKVFED